MKKRLIASDYDGTLYRFGKVSEEDRNAILRWQAAGGLFGMVTGRGYRTPQYLAEVGVQCDFYLVHNGATMLDRDGNILRQRCMEREAYMALEQTFDRLGGTDRYDRWQEESDLVLWGALMPTIESARDRAVELNQLFPDTINAVANGLNINVMAKGEGKAEGIGYALDYYGLPQDAAAAVGDDYNDLDMLLKWDGWCMADGRPEVVAAVRNHCTSIADLVDQLMAEK